MNMKHSKNQSSVASIVCMCHFHHFHLLVMIHIQKINWFRSSFLSGPSNFHVSANLTHFMFLPGKLAVTHQNGQQQKPLWQHTHCIVNDFEQYRSSLRSTMVNGSLPFLYELFVKKIKQEENKREKTRRQKRIWNFSLNVKRH